MAPALTIGRLLFALKMVTGSFAAMLIFKAIAGPLARANTQGCLGISTKRFHQGEEFTSGILMTVAPIGSANTPEVFFSRAQALVRLRVMCSSLMCPDRDWTCKQCPIRLKCIPVNDQVRPVAAGRAPEKRTLANLAAGTRGAGELWRSRFDAERNLVVINNRHRDFVYTKFCPDSPVCAVYGAGVLTDPPPPTSRRAHRARKPRPFNLRSLGLDSRGLDEGPPLLDLRLVMRAKRSSGLLIGRRDVLAQVLEPLANGGVRERFDHRRVELRDGGGGRAGRNPDPVPNRTGGT